MMTKRHFEAIATALRDDAAHINAGAEFAPYHTLNKWQQGAYDQWNTTVLALAAVCAAENPRFDRARFLTACGVQS